MGFSNTSNTFYRIHEKILKLLPSQSQIIDEKCEQLN